MSVYDLYQSYLNQAKASPVMASPVMDPNYLLYLQQMQQQSGGAGDDKFTNVIDPSQANAGITSFSGLADYLNPGGMMGGALFGPVGAIAGRGIGNLISNIRDPYKTFTGALQPDVQSAIDRDLARDVQAAGYGYGGGGGRAGGGGFGGGTAGGFSESDPSATEGSF